MTTSPSIEPQQQPTQQHDAELQSHLRGSSLLLVGRFLALALNLATQVLTVRVLSRQDYGLFSYAMAAVTMLSLIVSLGLDKALSRMAALYRERMDYQRLFGGLALAAGSILALSGLLAAVLLALRPSLPQWLHTEPLAIDLLCVLFVLAPLSALDSVVVAYYSVFTSARAIFLRRHVMVPMLRLLAVVTAWLLSGTASALAATYAAAMLVGTALNGMLLASILVSGCHVERWQPRRLIFPFRDLLGVSLPLLSSHLALLAYESFLVFLVEYFHGAGDVAALQAVRPFARLNELVIVSFAVLYVPAVARLQGRGDSAGIVPLHGQTALWIGMATFPILAVTLGLGDLLVAAGLGHEYADARRLLATMSLGYFISSITGINLTTLMALGMLTPYIILNLACAASAMALGLALVPHWGADGASLALLLSLAGDGALSCWMLQRATGIPPIVREHRHAWAALLIGVLLLVGLRFIPGRGPVLDVTVSLGACALAWGVGRRSLRILDLFPELRKVPLVTSLVR